MSERWWTPACYKRGGGLLFFGQEFLLNAREALYTRSRVMKGEVLPGFLSDESVLDGRYQIVRELGRGGVGVVVLATHLQSKDRVAIKALLGNAAPEQAAVDRLLQDAQAASALQSEHLARVIDHGTLPGGFPYVVTGYLQGESLASHLESRGTLPVNEALEILLQACEAIAEAHSQRLVHRALRPSNLFLSISQDGGLKTKVLDFGIASYLTSGKVHLRPLASAAGLDALLYLAPEQLLDLTRVDPRSDVWALGAILYEMLCGEPPFVGSSVAEIAFSINRDEFTPLEKIRPGLPADLERIVARCLAKQPDERISSVVALVRELTPLVPGNLRSLVERVGKMEPAHAAITIPAAASAPSGGDEGVRALYEAASGSIGAARVPSMVEGEDGDPDAHTRIQTRSEEMNALLQASLPSSRRQKILAARAARAAQGDPSRGTTATTTTEPPQAPAKAPTPPAPEPPTPSGKQVPLPVASASPASSGRGLLILAAVLLLALGAFGLRAVLSPTSPAVNPASSR